MQVRTFQARQIHEALSIVKREMGADAVILSTRKLRRGLGLLGSAGVEVTAAMDGQERMSAGGAAATGAAPAAERVDPDTDRQLGTLRREIRVLREQLRETSDLAANLTAQLPTPGAEWRRVLEQADVDPALASEIVRAALARTGSDDEGAARPAVIAEIVRRLPAAPADDPAARAVALIGPTGVGKTTTLAKIAARAALSDGKRVVLLTLDTHRVGAVAQLGRYAELIGVPFEAVRDPAELGRACRRHETADLWLIDTAGRTEAGGAEDLAACLRAVPGAQVCLVVPAAARRADLRSMLRRFAALGPTRLAISKTDETALLGGLLNAAVWSGLPLAWIASGPRVPEDLSAADPESLAQRILDMEIN